MNEQIVFEEFKRLGIVIANTHVVLASGRHGSSYIDKDMLYPNTSETSDLCYTIAKHFAKDQIKVVVGPEKGGIILSQWVAYHLSAITGQKVLAFYAEKADGGFVFKRGGAKERISGKRVLVVEDILTTGGSVKQVIELVRTVGGIVIGLGALCNRGGVTPEEVANPPELFSLVNEDFIKSRVDIKTWAPEECELCKQKVPINTDVGKGKEFLARRETK